jgi:hypothetical protein
VRGNVVNYCFLTVLLVLFSAGAFAQDATFIFVHINESIMPIERGKKYADPLHGFLYAKGLGEVTGGGSSLSETGEIQWVGVDVELVDPEKNLPLLIKKLRELGAPKGSFLEYSIKDQFQKVDIW